MKKITLALLASASLLMASDHHEEPNNELVTYQTFTNDIIDNTNQVEFVNSGKKMGATGIVGVGDKHNIIDLALRYQPIDHLGFDIRLPIQDNDFTDETGIGDASVSVNYHFGQFADTFGTNIFTFRYKSTSGDEDKGLGTGEDAYTLTYTMANEITDDVRFYGLLTYTMNPGEYTDSTTGTVIDYDDSYAGMLGASYESTVSTNAKVTYFGQDDLSVSDFWIELSTKKVIPNVPLAIGVKIPITNKDDNFDYDKTYLFYLSVSSFFF